jgi:toxin ParE1/3/4
MPVKILPAAKERILDIWDYTERTWGEEQAHGYVRGLVETLNAAHTTRHRWRPVVDDALSGVFSIRYRHHYLFFRELSDGSIGLISVLHENMNIPNRLKEDSERSE